MDILDNNKSSTRAFAKTFVRKKPEVIEILKKHGSGVSPSPTNKELLESVEIFVTNPNFLNDLSNLVLKYGYKNANGYYKRPGVYYNATGVLSTVAGSILDIFGARSEQKVSEEQTKQTEAMQNQMLMQMVLQEENQKAQEKKTTTIIAVSLMAIVVIIGTIILIKKS
jgi:hypothetical protein